MKKRLFIAVKLNETTINELRLFQKKLTRELPFKGIRWVDPGLFHLTLQFLGDTEERQFPTLISNLESAASKVKPFELSVEGAGFFGSNASVRVLWAGTRPSSELRNLFNEVILATAFLRLEQDPRFSPHLTLARVADWLPKEESSRIVQIITENKAKVFGVTKITSIYLIESVLNPAGPVYKTMKIFDLV